MRKFLEEAERICRQEYPSKSYSPAKMLGIWEELIDECKEGYNWDVSEYHNELGIRNTIELLIKSETAKLCPEYRDFYSNVVVLDKSFRELLKLGVEVDSGRYWWERGVLVKAGEEIVGYYHKVYGTEIELKK